jgi:GDP-L-fucose synthase
MPSIFIAGHRGLVGSALVRHYQSKEGWKVLTRTRQETDLSDAAAVRKFFEAERPSHVVVAAAKVGGIKANNDFPVEFLLENLKIQNNVIESAHAAGVAKLLFLGSSCIYPKLAPQPLREESLLTGPLEPTNEAYAIAKIAGIKLCQAYAREYGARFISAMPTNLYGPNDNFDPEGSHVLPAMILKFHRAKVAGADAVTLWGTGTPFREFLHADDMAAACGLLIDKYESPEIINIGTGIDLTIADLAAAVRDAVGFKGRIEWDATKPDGTPKKQLDIGRIRALGWEPRIPLREGIASAYRWFLENHPSAKA